jgi:hypothetical protein
VGEQRRRDGPGVEGPGRDNSIHGDLLKAGSLRRPALAQQPGRYSVVS